MRTLKAAVIVVILAGCAQQRPAVDLSGSVDPLVLERYNVPGTGSLTGQAFLRQVGGDVVTCAGSEVFLMPKSRLTDDLITAIRAGDDIQPLQAEAAEYPFALRKTTCDAQGNFEFSELAAGTWFVGTHVFWGIPSRYGVRQEGAALGSYVEISPDAEERILLSGSDRLTP